MPSLYMAKRIWCRKPRIQAPPPEDVEGTVHEKKESNGGVDLHPHLRQCTKWGVGILGGG
jgi:hypothetical protein